MKFFNFPPILHNFILYKKSSQKVVDKKKLWKIAMREMREWENTGRMRGNFLKQIVALSIFSQ